jgi:type II secretory pathway predicted ATPase ExeA/septal ring-binding cell division protein DamX
MYLEHFGLREAPFRITPHTEFFFAGANRGETLEALIYAITSGEGIVKVVGEVGSGKTMLCRVLMERLPETVETIYLAVPSVSRDEMLGVIADDLGIEMQAGRTTKLLRALQERLIQIHTEGRQVVALVDEAHAMPPETLEEIRLLSNLETSHDKLMQIVLFGQPELDAHLSTPGMRQLKERITHAFSLAPLPPNDIRNYLDFRLRAAGYKGPDLFGPDTIQLIAEASEGLTRRINIYADKSLLAAFAAGTHTIQPDHVRAAIADTGITVRRSTPALRIYVAAGVMLAAGLLIGFLSGQQFGSKSTPPLAETARITAPISRAQAAPETPGIAATQTQPVEGRTDIGKASNHTQQNPALPAAAIASAVNASAQQPVPAPAASDTVAMTASEAASPPTQSNTPLTVNEWVAARLDADRVRLDAISPTHWSIQLMTADRHEHAGIVNFLKDAGRSIDTTEVYLFPIGGSANQRIGLVFGDFPVKSDALNALAKLPQRVVMYNPYARTFNVIREDRHRSGKS